MKSKSSDMIRVLNELIPRVKKLNDLHRSGFQTEVEQGLTILISAIERGESIGDSAILQRLDHLEKLLGPTQNKQFLPVEVESDQILTEAELCKRFNIPVNWRSGVHGWVAETWLSQKTGAEYLGNDLYRLQTATSHDCRAVQH